MRKRRGRMGERGWGGCKEDDVRKRRQRMSGCQEEEGEEGEDVRKRMRGAKGREGSTAGIIGEIDPWSGLKTLLS